jgi:2-amino-4-hydroxy-6-hydroxymethyldihydropteridine diphosphokinase
VVLSLGSNLGNRLAYLESGTAYLSAGGVVRVLRASSVYETEPVQCHAQRWFFNQAVLVQTDLPPLLLLSFCQRVEALLGRRRSEWHGPRTLDIDILLVGGLCLKTAALTLPHPALPGRRSILQPLAELGTGWRHPVLGAEAPELLSRCPDHSRVIRAGSGGNEG